MNIVFFGTPLFAKIALEELINSNIKIKMVVTQPDSCKGRGKKLCFPEVKTYCIEKDIDYVQSENVNSEEFLSFYEKLEPDLTIVVAFGQILKKSFLKIAKNNINAHGSLLPKYRGAAPIHAALLYGEKETGVTIQFVKRKLDAGDIIYQEKVEILDNDDFDSLYEKLAKLSGKMVLKVIKDFENDNIKSYVQDENEVSYFGCVKKEQGRIEFNKNAHEIVNMIKAFENFPSAFCYIDNLFIKIFNAKAINKDQEGKLGEVVNLGKDFFTIKCKDSLLMVFEIQLESKKRMRVEDFFKGNKTIKLGTVLK
jgi:methionyl-tRNA formyltransferase